MTSGLLAATFVGAVTQRATGIGFSLVSAPFFALILGPVVGISLGNATALVFALATTVLVIRDVDWKLFGLLAASGTLGVIPGALLALHLPADALRITVGSLVLVGIAASTLSTRTRFVAPRWTAVPAGFLSGAMGASASVGGPAIAAYAVAARLEPRTFAATAQPYFALSAATAIAAKWMLGGDVLPDLPPVAWALLVAAGAVGIAVGSVVARRVSAEIAWRAVILIAALGAMLTIARGVLGLVEQ